MPQENLSPQQREAKIRRMTIERNLEMQRRMNEQAAQTQRSPEQLSRLLEQEKAVRAKARAQLDARNAAYNKFLAENTQQNVELNRQRSKIAGYDVTKNYTKNQIPRPGGNAPLRNVIFSQTPTNAANSPNRATPKTPQTPANPTNGGSLSRPNIEPYPSTRELMRISDPRNAQIPQYPRTAAEVSQVTNKALVKNPSNPSPKGVSNTGSGSYSGVVGTLGRFAFEQGVVEQAYKEKEINRRAEAVGLQVDYLGGIFDGVSPWSPNSLEEVTLQEYINKEQAKPEVRRKLYDAIMANQASGGGGSSSVSGGGFQGRMNSASPTAGTRPSLPAYTPRIPDPNFPGGFVPASAEERAKILQNPDFNPLAGDIPSFAPSDFLIPKDPNYVPPKFEVGTYNGNLPDTFVPNNPLPVVPQPGRVPGKLYVVYISYSFGLEGGVDYPGTTYTAVYGPVNGISVAGKIASVIAYDAGGNLRQYAVVSLGTGQSKINKAVIDRIVPAPGYPPDPILPGAPQPAPQIPTDPDTGRPNLPDIGDLKPSIDAPTSPTRTPTPSPRNSPTGKPSLQTPPESTPRLNPTSSPNLQPLLDLLPAIAPASPSNPLANPSLPLNNPATSANTSNPTQPASGSGTGVTINGEPVQNGDTPIRQISAQPSRQITPSSNVSTKPNTGTYTTINGEPVNVPKDVTTPKGTIDPQKVEQQQQQKQPQPQPEAPRNTCDDPCIQGLSDKLDQQSLTAIEVNVFDKCDVDKDEPVFKKQSFKVPASLSITLKAMLNNLAQLQGNECKGGREAIASVPEWWQARRGSNIPQLAIIFAEQFSSGKLGGSRWTLCIPHYNRPKGSKPAIPSYNKGNWFGTLKLTDGSKLGVNAASSSECKRVLNRLKIHIPVEFRTSKGKAIKPRIVEDPTADFKQCKVTPVRADYYSKGQTNMTPDWSINLRKK